jgi:Protein of unknown function (DUF3631)
MGILIAAERAVTGSAYRLSVQRERGAQAFVAKSAFSPREHLEAKRAQAAAASHAAIARRDARVLAEARSAAGITPAVVLDTLAERWFRKYAILPSRAAETFLVLWAAHTWYRDGDGSCAFKVTPRAWLLSREPGSAKSLVLALLAMLSYKVASIEIEPTAPGLKMILGNEKGTPFLDEGDILFNTGSRAAGVRAIMNAGYSRVGLGGTVTNGIGGKANRVKVFGPLAMAGLDVVETGTDDKLVALLQRGVKIRMAKASPAAVKALPRLEDDLVMGTAESDAEAGRGALEWVAGQTWDDVIGDPDVARKAAALLPDALDPRAAQIWNPLMRIAMVVGGDWPERCRVAAQELSGGRGASPVPASFLTAFAG